MNKKFLIIGICAAVLIAVLGWAFVVSSQPLPGVEEVQDGRNHAVEGTPLTYKFSPPTSGDHYPSWITKGFYDEPRADGNLVHSQEHGYVILWYDCEAKTTSYVIPSVGEGSQDLSLEILHFVQNDIVGTAYAQNLPLPTTNPTGPIGMTTGGEGSPSATLAQMPKAFSDGSCNTLKGQIKDVLNKFGPHKLVAVPRVHMGNALTLTAWDEAMKLTSVDQGQIKRFIDVYRDHGPEQTDEP